MDLYDGMLCPVCEKGHMTKRLNGYPFPLYQNGIKVGVFYCKPYTCDLCGESLWDDKAETEYEALSMERKSS